MGVLHRVGIALSAAAGWLGLTTTPDTDPERLVRIAELYAGYVEEFPDVPGITAEELLARQAAGNGPVLVDARTPREREVSRLPGAVDAEEVEAHPESYEGRPIVAYCTIGYRSGLWAEKMRARGLDVTNLEGSLLSWTHEGGPLVAPDGSPTTRVHVYGPTWDLTASGYEAVW